MLNNDDHESRRLVENCYRTHKTLVNPIIDWSDADVWGFIKHHNIKVNPLYAGGACRVGCIGCPMAGKSRYAQFYRYPKYQQSYIRAFDRMIKRRIETGLNPVWKDGAECFKWWIEDKNLDGQINIFDEQEDT